MANNTLYDTLEVIPSASQETIHAAYRSLMSRYHPDKVAALGQELQALAATRTKEINHAYSVLRDAASRASYDEQLRREATPPPHQHSRAGDAPSPPPHWQSLRSERSPPALQLLATGIAAIVGSLVLFVLPRLANGGLGIIFFLTSWNVSNFPHFRDFVIPLDLDSAYEISTGFTSLLILVGLVAINYWIGFASYHCGAGVGKLFAVSWKYGEIDCRRLLFLSFVFIIAIRELILSNQTGMRLIGSVFILVGAYRAKEKS